MASPILNGYFQYTTSNGNPLSGGTIGFYFPGTTTPKPIWTLCRHWLLPQE